MTAVSSFRPLDESSEVKANQLRAFESWLVAFDRIIYFGKYDRRLASEKTEFIELNDFPTIRALCLTAHITGDWCAVINADIVVSQFLPKLVEEASKRKAQAITSRRYEFEPKLNNMAKAKVVDSGYDFFMALPRIWLGAHKAVPHDYRLGHNAWDSWMLGFLNTVCRRSFFDITAYRCIFHPRHVERKRAYTFNVQQDIYTQAAGHPPVKL